jgi:hypothetical protein
VVNYRREVFRDLIAAFVSEAITASTSETLYLIAFKNAVGLPEDDYRVLDRLFGDIDAYAPAGNSSFRLDISEDHLREAALRGSQTWIR